MTLFVCCDSAILPLSGRKTASFVQRKPPVRNHFTSVNIQTSGKCLTHAISVFFVIVVSARGPPAAITSQVISVTSKHCNPLTLADGHPPAILHLLQRVSPTWKVSACHGVCICLCGYCLPITAALAKAQKLLLENL